MLFPVEWSAAPLFRQRAPAWAKTTAIARLQGDGPALKRTIRAQVFSGALKCSSPRMNAGAPTWPKINADETARWNRERPATNAKTRIVKSGSEWRG